MSSTIISYGVLVIICVLMVYNLSWLLWDSVRRKDKFLIILSIVFNIIFWLSIIAIALKVFGL